MIRSDVWLTPDDIYKELCEYWEFEPNIDVAASSENTKCKYFIDEKQNALVTDWVKHRLHQNIDFHRTKVWLNPPTSKIREYSEAVEAHFRNHKREIEILMIMPANSFCNPYQKRLFLEHLESGNLKIRPIYGKIQFLKGTQNPEQKTLAKFKPHKVGVAAQNWISLMFRKL